MATLNFPDPNVQTSYTNPDTGITYEWNNDVWKSVRTAQTAPQLFVNAAGDNVTGNLTFGTDKIVLNATTGAATFASAVDATAFTINGIPIGGSSSQTIVSDTMPTPTNYNTGTLWWNSESSDTSLYVLYQDPTGPDGDPGGKYWIEASPAPDSIGFNGSHTGDSTFTGNMNVTGNGTFAGTVGIGNSNPSALGTGRLVVGDGNASSETITVFSSTSGSANIHFADGTSGQDRYRGYISYQHNSNDLAFGTNDAEAIRIDSAGRLLVGTSASLAADSQLQIEGTTFYKGGASLRRNSNDAHGSALRICKSRGTSNGSYSVVSSGDTLGLLQFCGADGSADKTGAEIRTEVDGTPGANDMPGRLTFSVTADGESAPTERMRIDSSGRMGLGTLSINSSARLDIDAGTLPIGINLDSTNAGGMCNIFKHSGVNKLTIGTGGSSFLTGSSTADGLIRAEANLVIAAGGNTERMRIDSEGKVSIGSATSALASQRLTINYDTNSSTFSECQLLRIDGAGVSNEVGGIGFGYRNSSNSGEKPSAFIGNVINSNSGAKSSHLVFATRSATTDTEPLERLRIESSGNVNVGHFYSFPHGRLNIAVESTGSIPTGSIVQSADSNLGLSIVNHSNSATYSGIRLETRTTQASSWLIANEWNSAYLGSLVFRNRSGATGSSERMRIDSAGRLLVGTSTARAGYNGGNNHSPFIQFESTGNNNRIVSITANGTNWYEAPSLNLSKSRAASIGGTTLVAANDLLGDIQFNGYDGSVPTSAASIGVYVDGTPGSNIMPGRLVFETTAIGENSPTERMRIDASGIQWTQTSGHGHFVLTARNPATENNFMYFNGRANSTGFNTGTNTIKIFINGDIQNTNNSYTGLSDITLKENIAPASEQWDNIKDIKVVNYNFKEETGHQTHKQLGVIAQQVEEVSPGLVKIDDEGLKSVNYSVLYMKAVKALQEAMERIETLEAKVAALEAN